MIYLDHNATTPLHPNVRKKFVEWLDLFGNPSSLHLPGKRAFEALEVARHTILNQLGCSAYQLLFTSGGTEANLLALQFLYRQKNRQKNGISSSRRRRILFSAIEHPSLLCQQKVLQEAGYEVLLIPVNSDGIVDLDFIEDRADDSCSLVAVMLANNETGVLQPVAHIAAICRSKGILFHCDAIQAPGKTKVAWHDMDADTISLSAHKVYALKGCGALLFRKRPSALFCGGTQEHGLRAGTENLLGILAFAEALKSIGQEEVSLLKRLKVQRNLLEERLSADIPCHLIAKNAPRLTNTLSVIINCMENDLTVLRLSQAGFAISRGAACHSAVWQPSHVLLAMGLSQEEASCSVRISLGRDTESEHIEQFVQALAASLENFHSRQGKAAG